MTSELRCIPLLLIAIAAVGCNGSNDDAGGAAACGDFKACGGNVVGEWNVEGMCFDDVDALVTARKEPECQDLIRNVDVHVAGTYQFTADGNVSRDVTFSFDMDALWSTKCLRAIAKGAVDLPITCSGLEANYASNPQFAGASCEVKGTDCSCMVTSVDSHSAHTGTYTTDGAKLTEDEGPGDYCVAGTTLKMHGGGTDGGGTDGGGTMTLKR